MAGEESTFSQSLKSYFAVLSSIWISLTLNTTLNYSQKFTRINQIINFILHSMWTGPVGKIGNSENIKFLKIHINQISTV